MASPAPPKPPELRKKHTCFHCGDLATATVSQLGHKAVRRWICMKRACWDAYYKTVNA